jgi:acyl-CoA dehydrogenase
VVIDTSKSKLVETARTIGADILAPHADDVDRNARFPHEAREAFKKAKLLGAYVPADLGGGGASMAELAAMCTAFAQHCASAAMVFAMHQIQVACMVRHSLRAPFFEGYLRELCEQQRLIASVTSEVGIGGEMRKSACAVERDGASFTLVKDATTISYGAEADDLLVTCRRAPDAPSNDQALVLVKNADYTLEKKGVWDTMGMRGTCSPPFKLTSRGAATQIMETPFAESAALTMVPVSHVLWASCWLGIATGAVARARSHVRQAARATPGTMPPTALRLAEAASMLQAMRASVNEAIFEYTELLGEPDGGKEQLLSIGYALKINNLKVSCSQAVVQIVNHALAICGIQGYKNDSKLSLGRHLRDAYSAALMVGNDRIFATNASMLLVLKDD